MSRSTRRILILVVALPLVLVAVAMLYSELMSRLENAPRDFWTSLQWAAETFTSTGYGSDSRWSHPAMVVFVILVQLLGVATVFLVFPFYLVPFFEDRFEGRLPARPPRRLHDYVLVYRWGSAVVELVESLRAIKRPVLVFEEDESVARRIRDRGVPVVFGRIDEGEPTPDIIAAASAIVANGEDHENGTLILSARQQGFDRRIIALAADPFHRGPMMAAGAEVVYTPTHILAAALASRASSRIEPIVSGVGALPGLRAYDLRVADAEGTPETVEEIERLIPRGRVVGVSRGGRRLAGLSSRTRLRPRDLVTLLDGAPPTDGEGSSVRPVCPGLVPARGAGPIIIGGFGEVGEKVAQLLRDVGEEVRIIDRSAHEGVDVVGDLLDADVLDRADIASAKAIVIALSSDASTTFATSVIRSVAPHTPLVSRLNRQRNIQRIQLAGADYSLSLAAVAGRLLRHHLLGSRPLSDEETLTAAEITTRAWTRAPTETAAVCRLVAARGEDAQLSWDPAALTREPHVIICGPAAAVSRLRAEDKS